MSKLIKTYVLVPDDNTLSKNQRRRRNRRRNNSLNSLNNYNNKKPGPIDSQSHHNSNDVPSFREYQDMMYQKYIDTYLDKEAIPYKNSNLTDNPYYINENVLPTYSANNNYIYNDLIDKPYYYDEPHRSTTENVNMSINRPSDNLYTKPTLTKPTLTKPTLTKPTLTKPISSRSTYLDSLYDYEKSLNDIREKYGLTTDERYTNTTNSWKHRNKEINDELDDITIRQTELLNQLNNKNIDNELYSTSLVDKNTKLNNKGDDTHIYYTTFGQYKKKINDSNDGNVDNKEETTEDSTSIPPTNGGDLKKELCFCLPLDNSSIKTPETTDGLLQILFPSLKSKGTTETNDEPEKSKRRDRSKFINGEAINMDISSLDDLINLANKIGTEYSLDTTYSLDIESLQIMKPSLEKLNNMVGLLDIKKRIVHQIIFYLQGLDDTNKDMLHTVIEGDPGVGKTEIAKILGEIYGSLGILSKGTFQSVKRADLIGSYLGQTATKTLKVLEAAKGGVLFIDEAYSLGNEEGKDIYSKECIDTITAFLSENREDFICIIAGYRDALRQCFFKYNAGLERRFPWTYTITSYTDEELKQIFEKMVTESKWESKVKLSFFKENLKKFKHFGGDMENLFHKSKLAHSFRSLKLPPEEKKIIIMDDLEYGMKLFVQGEEEKKVINFMMYS